MGYVKEQQAQGNNCPILFLQEETDVEGNDVYRVRPSPFDLQGGMNPVDARDEICKITAKEFNVIDSGFTSNGTRSRHIQHI